MIQCSMQLGWAGSSGPSGPGSGSPSSVGRWVRWVLGPWSLAANLAATPRAPLAEPHGPRPGAWRCGRVPCAVLCVVCRASTSLALGLLFTRPPRACPWFGDWGQIVKPHLPLRAIAPVGSSPGPLTHYPLYRSFILVCHLWLDWATT
jgi:hypothetical protein